MLPFITAALGAALGAMTARRRQGNGFDMAQYAAVFGIIGGLLGLVGVILLSRV
ncbi:MAG: hypothetical protein AAFY65_16730 [Pseudomonadota bacterium]